jgi:hypothetical protein
MRYYSPDNSCLYDIVAELGYFNADKTKKDFEERKRVWVDTHNYCLKNNIPFDVFLIWLMKRLENKSESRNFVEIIKKKEREAEEYYLYGDPFSTIPTEEEWLSLQEEEGDEKDYDLCFYGDPCQEWKDDWDGDKF